jgi:hypothetical protein
MDTKVKRLVWADVAFLAVQVLLAIAALDNATGLAGILLTCTVALIGAIAYETCTIRGYIWVRGLSGTMVALYVVLFSYAALYMLTHVD